MTPDPDKLFRYLRERVTWEVQVEPSDVPLEGNVMVTGDDEADAQAERHVRDALLRGHYWEWCDVRVTVHLDAAPGFRASDIICACSYESVEAAEESMADDLINQATHFLASEIMHKHSVTTKLLQDAMDAPEPEGYIR